MSPIRLVKPSSRLVSRSLLGMVALALVACTPPTGGLEAEDVAGHWVLEEGTLPDGPFPFTEGRRITLVLGADGSVRGRSACNAYASDFRLQGGVFELGAELAATTMACEPEVMEAEEALFRTLPTLETASLEGDRLVLEGNGSRLAFSPLLLLEVSELAGEWVIDGVGSGETVGQPESEPHISFGQEGDVVGFTGCGPFEGTYVIEGDEVLMVSFDEKGDCPGTLGAQHDHVIDVIGSVFAVEQPDNELILRSQGGRFLVLSPR